MENITIEKEIIINEVFIIFSYLFLYYFIYNLLFSGLSFIDIPFVLYNSQWNSPIVYG